jgi:hypothetical protein
VWPDAHVQSAGVSGAAHVLLGGGDPESTAFDPASVTFFPASVVALLPESPPLSP